jgi:medium-chain acyl-[acyl-carrier-protein] hydrolase
MNRSPWVSPGARIGGGSVRLFCFPYAGGGASRFRNLIAHLPRTVDVLPIQLPGREERLGEPLYEDMDRLVDVLSSALEPQVRGRCAFLGYSLGAYVAFEVARALARAGRPLDRLIVSAAGAPDTLVNHDWSCAFDDRALLARVRQLGATPESVLDDADTMSVLLPGIRADFRLLHSYRYEPGPLLRSPIHVLGGAADSEVPVAELEPWKKFTHAKTTVQILPGDHFFIHRAQSQFFQAVLSALQVERDGSRQLGAV